ncbi:hypothetical protein MAP00_001237 [Monascus purpureus]|nr:hypothetical protein MAP00_001237 [Monascus purpureus]
MVPLHSMLIFFSSSIHAAITLINLTMEKEPNSNIIPDSPEPDDSIDRDIQQAKQQERNLLRKIDLHLVFPLWVLFVFGFLDRINLGNASVLGVVKDLDMSGTQLAVAMQVFFVPYILFDVPSNIVLRRVAPSVWISALAFLWGITSMCQGFVKHASGLIACRFFMGLFEAGFVPGCTYLMAMFYQRHEYQRRFSLFWVAGLVAGAFGGLLAYALNHMDGLQGYAGWRWIFIIEGLLSAVLAVPMKFILADWPDQARFLSGREKELLRGRLARDLVRRQPETDGYRGISIATMDRLDRTACKRILSDWKIYIGSIIYLGVTVSGYATALFIPSIMASLGYSGIQSQIHSIPVWIVAAVVTLLVSVATDRLKHRYGFIMFGVFVASIGYVLLLCRPSSTVPVGVHYMAVFFVTTGTYIVQPVTLVWMANNLAGHYKRAVGLAVQVGVGNVGGIIASNVFNADLAPQYTAGYAVSLGMMLLCGVMSSVFAWGVATENRRRERGGRDYRLRVESALRNMGDDDPRFRFVL